MRFLAEQSQTDTAGNVRTLLVLAALAAWLVAVCAIVGRLADRDTSPPARWSYVAALWSVVLAPVAVLKAAGVW